MRRILILCAAMLSAAALPAAAEAAVIPTVSGDTLTVTGDGAADTITLRLIAPTHARGRTAVTFNSRATFTQDRDPLRRRRRHHPHRGRADGAGDDRVRRRRRHRDRRPGRGDDLTGDDADLVQPGGGDDTVLLGAATTPRLQGDGLRHRRRPGGNDTLLAIGTDESEEFTLQAVGGKARVARDTGPPRPTAARSRRSTSTAAGGPDLSTWATCGSGRAETSTPTSACRRRARPDRRPGHRRLQQHRRAAVPRDRAGRGPGPDDPDPERPRRRRPADGLRARRRRLHRRGPHRPASGSR